MAIGDLFGSFGFGGGGGLFDLIFMIFVAVLALIFIIGIFFYFKSRKQWNIKVEFKLPRSVRYGETDEGAVDIDRIDGLIDAEWGKGSFNAKKGVCWLKRKGRKKVKMRPFNISRYLQGNILTVVQIGAEDYRPVMPESYMVYEDDKTKADMALLKLKVDTSESKAWKNSFERDAKSTYSIINLFREYAPILAIGIVILLWGIQMMILYNRIK